MAHRARAGREVTTDPLFFDGGISYLDQSQVRPNQHVAGRNWILDRDNVVRVRPGNRRWNATALGARFQGLWDFRKSTGENTLVAYAGGTLQKGHQPTQVFTELLAGLNASVRGWAEVLQDLFWFCNGIDTPRVTDLGSTFRIGIVHPAAAPTVALVALAGNLPAEDHFYRYTYVREDGGVKTRESNPSAESVKVTNTAGSAQNDVTVVASADAQVTHIYIYRRSATTTPEEKFVAKVSNTGQTYRDNIAATALGGFAFWTESGGEEDHGYPLDTIYAIELHRDGRLYAWGPKSRLHYTRVLQPAYYPGSSGGVLGGTAIGVTLIINEDDGDEGVVLISESDDLLCLKRYNAYRLIGDGPTADDGTLGNWRVEKVATRHGCAAPASAARGEAGTFWTSDEGPVRVDERSGLPIPINRQIEPWIRESSDITKAHGWVQGRYYFLYLPFIRSGVAVWEGHVYNVVNPSNNPARGSWWPIKDLYVEAIAALEDGTMVWGGSLDDVTLGVVYEWDRYVNDHGRAITAELTTRVVDPHPGITKWFHARLAYQASPGDTMTMRLIPDQTPSYVERVVKLVGQAGSRMVRLFRSTKRLQGAGLQLSLKSASAVSRPAIYYWQVLAHLLDREGRPPFFADVVPDGELDWGPMSAEYVLMDSYDHMA